MPIVLQFPNGVEVDPNQGDLFQSYTISEDEITLEEPILASLLENYLKLKGELSERGELIEILNVSYVHPDPTIGREVGSYTFDYTFIDPTDEREIDNE